MAETAADRPAETMLEWGVDTVFGLPGEGITGVIEALRTRQDRLRFIQVRYEEAAFACVGYGEVSGKPAARLATSGPGGVHLLNGLYGAKLDGVPVLAITGETYHDLLGTPYQQAVDLNVVFKDGSVSSERAMGPAHVENVAALACRRARAYRGVAHLSFPVDLQERAVGKRPTRRPRRTSRTTPRT